MGGTYATRLFTDFAQLCIIHDMEHRISATELARKLGDILARVRYRGDSFVVERNGDPVARLVPLPEKSTPLLEALGAWRAAGAPDPAFADDLERIGAADRPPGNAWAS
ncbi:MAG: type II toxin-antitoxin system Phd/YefM family antitoxin [Candidatus Methylomirabilia bacterium]